jgi:hypothetical protein
MTGPGDRDHVVAVPDRKFDRVLCDLPDCPNERLGSDRGGGHTDAHAADQIAGRLFPRRRECRKEDEDVT